MTDIQKQCLLMYLGYYTGTVDGIWGEKSKKATRIFREENGMEAKELFDDQAEKKILEVIASRRESSWWEEIQNFTEAEFACKCKTYCNGYPARVQRQLVEVAQRTRNHFASAVIVSSGVRCNQHNRNVGGVSNSRHLTGRAMDFCVQGKTSGEVLSFLQAQPEIRYAYAIDGSFVHMDIG